MLRAGGSSLLTATYEWGAVQRNCRVLVQAKVQKP